MVSSVVYVQVVGLWHGKLVDKYVQAKKVSAVTKIKYVANPLYGLRVGPAPHLVMLLHVPAEPFGAERGNKQEKGTTKAT